MANTINDTDEDKTYLLDDEDYDIFDAKGNDIYFLGDGNNTITDSYGNDTYVIGNGTNIIQDGFGSDTYMTGDGDYTIYVGGGKNVFYLGGGTHSVMDTEQWDNTYYLGDGEYIIRDGRGDSTFYLGNGFNYIQDAYGQDTYYLNNGINIIFSGSGNDTYYMGEGINYVFNNSSDGDIHDAADTFHAGAGIDYMDGGAFLDSVYYDKSDAAVHVDLANNTASGGYAEGDTLIRIENIVGSDLADQRDFLYGNKSINYLYGLAGDDVLEGGSSIPHKGEGDYLDGGEGWDYARYTRSSEAVNINMETGIHTGGDAEYDTLVNIEAIVGSKHNDTFTGSARNDYFKGELGNDCFFGGLGTNQLWGGDGYDTAEYKWNFADYTIINDDYFLYVNGDGLSDRLSSIEQLIFADGVYENGTFTKNQTILTGNTNLSGVSDITSLLGIDQGDILTVITTDNNGEQISQDITILLGDSAYDLANKITQAFADSENGEITASLTDAGLFEINATNAQSFKITTDFVGSGNNIDQDGFDTLGFGEYMTMESRGYAEHLSTTVVSGDTVYSISLYEANDDKADADDLLLQTYQNADGDTVISDFGVFDEIQFKVSIDDSVFFVSHTIAARDTFEDLINTINTNSIVNGNIEAHFDNGILSFTSLTDDVNYLEITTLSAAGGIFDLSFGDINGNLDPVSNSLSALTYDTVITFGDNSRPGDLYVLDNSFIGSPIHLYDFDVNDPDVIDISDLIEGYDPLTDNIRDFVTVDQFAQDTVISVNPTDDSANSYYRAAILHDVTGLNAADMETNGNLITV